MAQLQFQSGGPSEVNVNSQGSTTASNEATNIINSINTRPSTQAAVDKIVRSSSSLVGMVTKQQAAQRANDANMASADWAEFYASDAFANAASTNQEQMLKDKIIEAQGKGTAYLNSWTASSSSTTNRAHKGTRKELNTSRLNSLSAESVSLLEGGEVTAEQLVDSKFKEYDGQIEKPTLAKTVASSLISFNNKELLTVPTGINVSAADATEDLNETIADVQKSQEALKSDKFVNHSNPQVKAFYNKVVLEQNKVIKQKQVEIQKSAEKRIAIANDTSNPNVLNNYTQVPDMVEYQAAYGDKALEKYQADVHKFKEHETARIRTEQWLDKPFTNWSGETDTTKKALQQQLTTSIKELVQEDMLDQPIELIEANGGVDSKRLAGTVETFNAGLRGENGIGTYTTLMKIRSKNPGAFRALYPKAEDAAKIIALGPLMIATGKPASDVYDMIFNTDTITEDQRTKYAKIKVSKDILDEANGTKMKADLQAMNQSLLAAGVQPDVIAKTLTSYVDANPYTPDYSAYAPKVQDMMEGYYNDKLPEGYTLYQDVNTGSMYGENELGMVVQMGSKKEAYDYLNRVNKVEEYNKEHYIKTGFGDVMDTVSTSVSIGGETFSTVFMNGLKYLGNTGSAIPYDITHSHGFDGTSLKDEVWTPPNSYDSLSASTTPKQKGIDLVQTTQSIQAQTGDSLSYAIQSTADLVEGIDKLFQGEQGDLLVKDLIEPRNFKLETTNMDEGEKVQQEYERAKARDAQLSIVTKANPHLGIAIEVGVPKAAIDYLVKRESNGNYDAKNPSSTAEGKYQFIKSTRDIWADRLGIPRDKALLPENQDKIFIAQLKENKRLLQSQNMEVNATNLYAMHQLGYGTAMAVLHGVKLSPKQEKALQENVPVKDSKLTGKKLVEAWKERYKYKGD